jgi:hypothetical protein
MMCHFKSLKGGEKKHLERQFGQSVEEVVDHQRVHLGGIPNPPFAQWLWGLFQSPVFGVTMDKI